MTDSLDEVKKKQTVNSLKAVGTENSKPKSVNENITNKEEQLEQKENKKPEVKEITKEEIEKLKLDSSDNEKKIEGICDEFGEDIANLLTNICGEDKELTNDEKHLMVQNSIKKGEVNTEQKKEMLEMQNKMNKKIQEKKEKLLEKGEKLTNEEKKELETIEKYEELQKLQEKQKEIEEKISNSVGKDEKDQKKLDELKKLNNEKKDKINEKIKDCLPPQAGLIAVGPLVALIGVPPFSLIGLIAIMKILPMFPKKEVKQEITNGKGNSQNLQNQDKKESNKNTIHAGNQGKQQEKTNRTQFGNMTQNPEQTEINTTKFGTHVGQYRENQERNQNTTTNERKF